MSNTTDYVKGYKKGVEDGKKSESTNSFFSGMFIGIIIGAGALAVDYMHFGFVFGNSISYDVFGNRVTVRASTWY